MKNLILLITVFLICTNINAQYYINDHFEGDTLSSIWIQADGDSSNYEVANSNWYITNTDGGTVEGVWRWVRFYTDFIAEDEFYFSTSFDFNNDRYKIFDISLHGEDISTDTTLWFRLWNSPSQWILIKGTCGYIELHPNPYPVDLKIYRSNDTIYLYWSDTLHYECQCLDSINYLRFSFAQYTGDGDGCSSTGQIETGWTCSGEPSSCS